MDTIQKAVLSSCDYCNEGLTSSSQNELITCAVTLLIAGVIRFIERRKLKQRRR